MALFLNFTYAALNSQCTDYLSIVHREKVGSVTNFFFRSECKRVGISANKALVPKKSNIIIAIITMQIIITTIEIKKTSYFIMV